VFEVVSHLNQRLSIYYTLFSTSPWNRFGTPSKIGQASQPLHSRNPSQILWQSKAPTTQKPFLILLHKEKRRFYYREERAIKRHNRMVCWSNEFPFQVGEDFIELYVTRGPGREEESAEKNLRPTFKSEKTSVGVWSCFDRDEIGPLYMLP